MDMKKRKKNLDKQNRGTGSCDEPENAKEAFSPVNFIPGAIVWAKYSGYPWWPAMIEDDPDVEEYYWKNKNGKWFYHVTFLDDKVTRAWVSALCVRSFLDRPKQKNLPASHAKHSALIEAAEMKARDAMNMSVQERLKNFSFAHHFKGKWGAPLALDDSDSDEDEDEKRKDLIQMLLEELNEIESIKSTNSGNGSVSSLELKENEADHELSSKSDSGHENRKESRKLLTDACSSKKRKLTDEENHVSLIKIKEVEANRTEIEKDRKTFVLPKEKEVKSTLIKPKEENTSNRKDDSKYKKSNKVMKISKAKVKKSNKLDKLEEKIDNAEKNKEGTRSSIKKAYSKNTKTLNENKDDKTLNHCSNSKFKPPIKINENNACKDNQSSQSMNHIKLAADMQRQCNARSVIEDENFAKKEISENNLDENKQQNKASITVKKTKNSKNSENSRSIKENTKSEDELKENIVKILEKNLKSSLESVPIEENNATTSNNSSTTSEVTIKTENKRQEKNVSKKNLQKQDVPSITVKKTKSSKCSENSRNIEENINSEDELKENIVKTVEKNLKSSLESVPIEENNATTSNNSSTTSKVTIKTEKSKEKKVSKKNRQKEDAANLEIHDNKKSARKNKSTKANMQWEKYIKNVTENLSGSSTGKSNVFKALSRQNISKNEKKVMRNHKTDKVMETEGITENQDNGIVYTSDEDVKEEISCDNSKKEIFSLSVEMNLQETEEEDSDPFEAE